MAIKMVPAPKKKPGVLPGFSITNDVAILDDAILDDAILDDAIRRIAGRRSEDRRTGALQGADFR